jgi:hypothetical protein
MLIFVLLVERYSLRHISELARGTERRRCETKKQRNKEANFGFVLIYTIFRCLKEAADYYLSLQQSFWLREHVERFHGHSLDEEHKHHLGAQVDKLAFQRDALRKVTMQMLLCCVAFVVLELVVNAAV